MLHNNQRPRNRTSHDRGGGAHAIGVGSRVSVRDLDTGELDIYTLVLPVDADISQDSISTLTPLGGAIFGRKSGDVVEFMAPGGLIRMRIESAQQAPVADATGSVP